MAYKLVNVAANLCLKDCGRTMYMELSKYKGPRIVDWVSLKDCRSGLHGWTVSNGGF